ncbi:Uncharacterised protein [Actinobacillus pleuropneumoniae]|nr:Uncharacterised protein [Actinobacillus pleuropneumoniae]
MNAFLFRSMIGIFFGAFVAVMTTSALNLFWRTIDNRRNAFYSRCIWLYILRLAV